MEFYATLGGSCADRATLDGLFAAGMTGARLNLSHTTPPSAPPCWRIFIGLPPAPAAGPPISS